MRVNWVAKMLIYFAILTFAGPFFDNWATTEKLLFLSDAYVNNCPESLREGEPTETFKCESQQIAVSGLISYARMFEFISSMPLGICVDRFGPRVVCLFGVTLCIASWVLLGFLPKYGAMLTLSMILIGMSTNAILFPGITIELYTKKYKSQVIIFICASSSITCFVVKALEVMVRRTSLSPRMVIFLFIVCVLVPCITATFLFFPDNIKKDVRKIGEKEKKAVKEKKGSKEEQVETTDKFSLEAKRMTSALVFEAFSKSIGEEDEEDESSSKESELPETMALSRKISLEDHVSRQESKSDISTDSAWSKWNWRGFLKSLNSVEVILCSLYYCLNVIGITYCQQSYTIVYSDRSFLLEFMEYVLPFSFVPCVFFMVYTKFFSPFSLLMTMGLIWASMDISSMFQTRWAGMTTAILFTVSYSIYNTHVNVYLETKVNKDYFSSILGFMNTAGGISLLFNILLIREKPDLERIKKVHIGLLVVRVAFLAGFTYLFIREIAVRKSRERKSEAKPRPSGFEPVPEQMIPVIRDSKGDLNYSV